MYYLDKITNEFVPMPLGGSGGCKGGGGWNTEEILTESGEWVAPVTGWYEVTVIGGGYGAYLHIGTSKSGKSGEFVTRLIYFNKSDKVSVVIGSGGKAVDKRNDAWTLEDENSRKGGTTTFGTIVAGSGEIKSDGYLYPEFALIYLQNNPTDSIDLIGNPFLLYQYGSGGGSRYCYYDGVFIEPTTYAADGSPGAVILRYNDPAKDAEIEVPTSIFKASPNYFARSSLPTPAKTSLVVPAGLQVRVGGRLLQTEQDIQLSTSGVAEAGRDVYIYACIPSAGGTAPDMILSGNSTFPTGYNAENARKIGGFHCLCADVGEIEGHKLSGFVAGDILPNSVWDLLHRPVSDPAGMVWVKPCNKWMDIYLASWNGSKLVSEFGAVIADGSSAKAFHGELFEELFSITANKQLMSRADFMAGAYNSQIHAVIAGAADPDTTGGHLDTAGRRMISDYGLEDCIGAMWQWTGDLVEGGAYGKVAGTGVAGYGAYLMGSDWVSYPVSNGKIDGVNDFGQSFGYLRRLFVGGAWKTSEAKFYGPRSVSCVYYSASYNTSVAGRGVSEPWVGGMD